MFSTPEFKKRLAMKSVPPVVCTAVPRHITEPKNKKTFQPAMSWNSRQLIRSMPGKNSKARPIIATMVVFNAPTQLPATHRTGNKTTTASDFLSLAVHAPHEAEFSSMTLSLPASVSGGKVLVKSQQVRGSITMKMGMPTIIQSRKLMVSFTV